MGRDFRCYFLTVILVRKPPPPLAPSNHSLAWEFSMDTFLPLRLVSHCHPEWNGSTLIFRSHITKHKIANDRQPKVKQRTSWSVSSFPSMDIDSKEWTMLSADTFSSNQMRFFPPCTDQVCWSRVGKKHKKVNQMPPPPPACGETPSRRQSVRIWNSWVLWDQSAADPRKQPQKEEVPAKVVSEDTFVRCYKESISGKSGLPQLT